MITLFSLKTAASPANRITEQRHKLVTDPNYTTMKFLPAHPTPLREMLVIDKGMAPIRTLIGPTNTRVSHDVRSFPNQPLENGHQAERPEGTGDEATNAWGENVNSGEESYQHPGRHQKLHKEKGILSFAHWNGWLFPKQQTCKVKRCTQDTTIGRSLSHGRSLGSRDCR